jgi:DNA-binding LacI/PurR family transcriptional regulator
LSKEKSYTYDKTVNLRIKNNSAGSMVGIREIAKIAGVSPASVSIYLNDKETSRVGAATKRRIDKAVKELNYHKNIFASTLSSQESRIIGVIIPSKIPLFSNEYTNALLSGVQSELSSEGYSLLFFPSDAHTSPEIVEQQIQRSTGCDGYILFSTGFCTQSHIEKNIIELQKTSKPFVTLNIPEMEEAQLQVLIRELEVCTGTKYLIGKGHRNIALVLGRNGGSHAKKLYHDHQALLEEAGITFDPTTVIYGDYQAQTAYEIVKRLLKNHPEITALNCMSDIMAAGALLGARELGYRVPDDLSIIGRNNSLHARLSTPAITTIDLHIEEAGKSAAQLLLNAIEKTAVHQKILIPGTLIERETVSTIS